MGFDKIPPEELKNFKVVDAYKLHNDCYCIVVELPSARNYPRDIAERDHRYLTGVIWTFPFDYQLDLLKLVIGNKVRPSARNEYIGKVQGLLNELKPFENLGSEQPLTPEEYKEMTED